MSGNIRIGYRRLLVMLAMASLVPVWIYGWLALRLWSYTPAMTEPRALKIAGFGTVFFLGVTAWVVYVNYRVYLGHTKAIKTWAMGAFCVGFMSAATGLGHIKEVENWLWSPWFPTFLVGICFLWFCIKIDHDKKILAFYDYIRRKEADELIDQIGKND